VATLYLRSFELRWKHRLYWFLRIFIHP